MTTTTAPSARAHARPRRAPRSRRGVALMLVLVALGVAGASTAFYLASRDNSAAIGVNARQLAAADWSAHAAAEVAIAIMQTQSDWMAKAASGTLGANVTLAGGEISIVVTDLQGAPPDSADTDLVVTASATVNGVRSVQQRIVRIHPTLPPAQAIDPFLGEFGVYAVNRLEVDASTVSIWSASPRARAGSPGKMGLGSANNSDLVIDSDAAVARMGVYVPPTASAALRASLKSPAFADAAVLPVAVRALPAVAPSTLTSLPAGDPLNILNLPVSISGAGTKRSLAGGRYPSVTVQNDAAATISASAGGRYSVNHLTLMNNAVLVVDGNVAIQVRGSLTIDSRATIEFASDASRLTMYVAGSVSVQDAALGVPRAVARNAARDPSDLPYSSPGRLRVLGTGTGSRSVVIDSSSLVLACIHEPYADVVIESGGSVVGQVIGQRVRVSNDGLVLVDPALDNLCGFTALEGPLYNIDGSPITGLATALAAFNAALGVEALPAYIAANVATPAATPAAAGEGEPTPRSATRLWRRDWPLRALGMERKSSGDTRPLSGSYCDATALDTVIRTVAPESGDDVDIFRTLKQTVGGVLEAVIP